MLITYSEEGELQDALLSGWSEEETERLLAYDSGPALAEYLKGLREPLRTRDFVTHASAAGFAGFPVEVKAFLGMRIRNRDRHVGNIYLGEKEDGGEFTLEDEENVKMFATHAAAAITNARRYGDEQRAKADLEALVNTSPVGVLVVDAVTRELVKINHEARRIIGCGSGDGTDCAQALGQVQFRRLDGTLLQTSEVPYERAARTGETVYAEELVIGPPSGDQVTALVNTTPVLSDEDDLIAVVVTIQDMTSLEELERLRTDFLAMVSHELRTPLTSIKGSAATVLAASSPLDPAETRQFFRIIEEQADHMRGLINNLLDLSRIESGNLSVVTEPTDVATVIDQARNLHSSAVGTATVSRWR